MRLRLCIALALFAAAIPCFGAATSNGLAYERIVWHSKSGTPPPPGSFAADRAIVLTQVKPTGVFPHPPLAAEGNMGPPDYAGFTSFYRFSYLGELSRIDDPIAQTAIIVRPDLGKTILLNLSKNTYAIVQMTPAPSPLPSVATPAATPTATSTPSMYNYRIESSVEALPDMVIDGVGVTGKRGTATFKTLQATPRCRAIELALTWTSYYANGFDAPIKLALPLGLTPPSTKCTFEHAGFDAQPSDKLIIYSSVQLDASVLGVSIPPIVTVSEYGNIVQLGPQDRALFDIPPGFTLAPTP
jgi:hypothetical protein